MKVSRLLVSQARERGLAHFFGIPGGGIPLDVLEAGRCAGVDFVATAHESSAAIAAGYYGLARGSAGLALAVRGVGAANLVGGVANAHFERVPLVAVCESAPLSAGERGLVQRCEQDRMFEGVTKHRATLTAEAAGRLIADAFEEAADGRPGPVLLNYPGDLGDSEPGVQPPKERSGAPPREERPRAVAQRIAQSSHPVILAGADVIRAGACRELLALAEAIEAAVLVTMDARGVFPESHPRWAGVFLGFFNPNVIESKVLARADLVIVAGVDAIMTHSPWRLPVDTCELAERAGYASLAGTPLRADGDLKTALARVAGRKQRGFSVDDVRAMRQEILPYFRRPEGARLAAQDVIAIARAVLPPEGVLVSETGAFICMLEHLWPVETPGTYLGTSGGRTMGLMVPAALGTKLAKPDVPMIGIGGDGSLLMRLGELESFARTGAALPLVIVNDQALGTMKSRQRSRGMADYGLDFRPVDFESVARACGLRAATVETPEAFEKELRAAMEATTATVIDARVDAAAYQASFGPTIGVLDANR